LGGDKYEAVMDIKMGPIKSVFNGTLDVVDKVEPQSYRLLIDVNAKIGTVSAQAGIALQPQEDDTALSFQADAKLSGLLARMGQRVLSGVARLFTNQFFNALEQELQVGKMPASGSPHGSTPN
jgi:carbon monoxide dehydrogenase subunit G